MKKPKVLHGSKTEVSRQRLALQHSIWRLMRGTRRLNGWRKPTSNAWLFVSKVDPFHDPPRS